MSDERQKVNPPPSYSALPDGELLALTLEQQSLAEGASAALAAELRRRGLGETEVTAFQRNAERAQAKQARWRRTQRMRLRELFSVLLVWPGMIFIPLGIAVALVFVLDPVLRDVLGLNQHQANLCEEVTAIGVVVVCFVAVAALILSKRTDPQIRRWTSSSARKSSSEEEEQRAHLRFCPARNVGYALSLFLFSLYVSVLSVRDVEGWSFLREQSPQVGWSYINTAGSVLLIIVCSYLVVRAPCFREKLWLAFATANFVIDLPKHLLHTMSGRELGLSRDISLVLWAAATIVALSFVKSASQGPTTRNIDQQL